MKYLKYIFILFGLFEIFAAYGSLTSSPEAINTEFGGQFITPESMHYVKGFGNAILSLGIISIATFFVKERLALIGIIIGCLIYNILAAYGCYVDLHLTSRYQVGMYAHSVFSVLFALMLVLSFRE